MTLTKQALKSAWRRTEKQNNIGSIPVPPQEIKPLESFENVSIKDMLNVTVVTEEDWKSVLAQANQVPDREDLVWVRDDNGDVVGAMINDPELIEIYNAAQKDVKK